MIDVVLASGNAGKLKEFNALFEPMGWTVRPQAEWDVPEAVEDGLSFVENALIKARHAARLTGLPALADDSGLAVDALNGEPGIHSARYAGALADDAANNRKLLQALQGVEDERRGAHFYCAIVMLRHAGDPAPLVATARWTGRILHEPRGSSGFGYDPLFFVPTEGCASAELAPARKNQLSHRGQALRALLKQFD